MKDLILFLLAGLVLFAICFAAMAVGMIVRGRRPKGGCGAEVHGEDKDGGGTCGFCSEKKKTNICAAENDTPLRGISTLGTLGRYEKDEKPEKEKKS